MQTRHRVRGVVNLLNLSTPAGVVLSRLGAGSLRRGPDDLWIADAYRLPLPTAPAFTMGSVVLFRRELPGWPEDPVAAIRPALLAHEARHATQYAYCGGLLMVPAYLACAGWSWLRTGDPGSRNVFERRAGLVDGGYRERPVRPLKEAVSDLGRRVGALRSRAARGSHRRTEREAGRGQNGLHPSRGASPGTASSDRISEPVGSNRALSSDSGVGVNRSSS